MTAASAGARRPSLQDGVHAVRGDEGPRLLEVWEASVRATHDFLTEESLQALKPHVLPLLLALPTLLCARSAGGELVAFLGVDGERLEALFVHPAWRGGGVGRRLARHAIEALRTTAVDVNEQNEQAVGFYRRLGFTVTGRSAVDSAGRPFPLLHMKYARPEEAR